MTAEATEKEGQILGVPVDVLEIGLAAAAQEGDGLGSRTAQSLQALRSWRNGQPLTGTVRVEVAEGMTVVVTPERTLALAADKYRGNRESPEALFDLMDAFWGDFGANLVRKNISLPVADLQLTSCPFTEGDLYNFRQQSVPDIGFSLPRILSDKEGLPILQAGLPQMSIHVQEGGKYAHQTSGWMYTESGLFTPNHGTTQEEAERIVRERSRLGLTPNTFIALSGLIKELEGRFIDEQSVSRVLGYVFGGRAAGAGFDSGGYCSVVWGWGPGGRDRLLGARSLGVKS